MKRLDWIDIYAAAVMAFTLGLALHEAYRLYL